MYQLVIVDDEVVQQAFKGIGIRKDPSGPCAYE